MHQRWYNTVQWNTIPKYYALQYDTKIVKSGAARAAPAVPSPVIMRQHVYLKLEPQQCSAIVNN